MSAAGDEYELLLQGIVKQLAKRAGVETTRLDRDVVVAGRATTNQIDVLWDFTDADGVDHRIVFEARDYGSAIKQGGLHAFRSVVDDIQSEDRPVHGVMVTATGYQRGAKRIAETYGLLVLELRSPTPIDLADRIHSIVVELRPVVPTLTEIAIEVEEMLDAEALADRDPWALTEVEEADRTSRKTLQQVLTDGELGTFDVPRAPHHVERVFQPPATMLLNHQPVATIRSVSAKVGSNAAPPVTVSIGGLESVAWMIRDALSGARLWFGSGDQIWSTDS